MAAHMSSSSSEDEDEKQRLREAVVDVATCTKSASSSQRRERSNRCPKRSLREQQHEDEEGFSTGISGEVRDFVAKKLSSYLDSCITALDTDHCNTEGTGNDGEGDCGFRLFSSSNPAKEVNLSGETPQPRRRKRVESSSSGDSDSDEEKTRLAEAAVTHDDILKSSAPLQVVETHSCSHAASTQEKVAPGNTTTVSNNVSNQSVWKKKKKKHRETSVQRTEGRHKSMDNVDSSDQQRPRKKKKSKLKSKDLMAVKKSTLCQSEQADVNRCSKEESDTQKTLVSKNHHKKKKRKKSANGN